MSCVQNTRQLHTGMADRDLHEITTRGMGSSPSCAATRRSIIFGCDLVVYTQDLVVNLQIVGLNPAMG